MRELLSREVSQGQPFTSLPIICSHTPCPWSLAEELVGLGKGVTPGSWSGRSWGRPQPSKPRGVWGPASSAGPWAQPSPGFLPACPLPPVVILEPALHPLVVCGCESECTPSQVLVSAAAAPAQLPVLVRSSSEVRPCVLCVPITSGSLLPAPLTPLLQISVSTLASCYLGCFLRVDASL